jgi:hypothetical protein
MTQAEKDVQSLFPLHVSTPKESKKILDIINSGGSIFYDGILFAEAVEFATQMKAEPELESLGTEMLEALKRLEEQER